MSEAKTKELVERSTNLGTYLIESDEYTPMKNTSIRLTKAILEHEHEQKLTTIPTIKAFAEAEGFGSITSEQAAVVKVYVKREHRQFAAESKRDRKAGKKSAAKTKAKKSSKSEELSDAKTTFNETDARVFYRFLGHRPDEYTELRIIQWLPKGGGQVKQEFVQSEEEFIKVIKKWNGKRQCYTGLNPRKTKGGKIEHVARVTAILFDVDSDHPKNQPANDDELSKAEHRMKELKEWIRLRGYSQPLVAMSGNGYHVIHRVDIAIDDDTQSQLEKYHHEAADDLDSMFDIPRIVKIPGTLSIKGASTEERPHRLSYIIDKGSESVDTALGECICSIEVDKTDPLPTVSDEQESKMTDTFENKRGQTLAYLRRQSDRLDKLLTTEVPREYPSASEADMATLSILLRRGYDDNKAVTILRRFRWREKLDRQDYIPKMLKIIHSGDTGRSYTPVSFEKDISPKGEGTSLSPELALRKITKDEGEKEVPAPSGDISFDEMTLDDVSEILSKTIVEDETNKKIIFCGGLLNFTEDDQMNIGLSAGSSTGKTYICLEVAKLFPRKNVNDKGFVSPKAFIHSMGQLVIDNEEMIPLRPLNEYVWKSIENWEKQNPRPDEGVKLWNERRAKERAILKSEWNKIPKCWCVDLHQKIIIFMDAPDDALLQQLRPLMSHDKKRLRYEITDKSVGGQLKTKYVVIVGYPSIWFLTTKFSPDEQERTRLLLLSPEVTQAKLGKSIDMLGNRLSDRHTFDQVVESDTARIQLKKRIEAIKKADIKQVLIDREQMTKIVEDFKAKHATGENSILAARHQRDFPRLVTFVKAIALLNMFNRKRNSDDIWVKQSDIDEGQALYDKIADSNELGLPPIMYDVYMDIIKPEFDLGEGVRKEQLTREYYKRYNDRVGGKRLDEMLSFLYDVGLTQKVTDPLDKRRWLLWPQDVDPPMLASEEGEAVAAKGTGKKKDPAQTTIDESEGKKPTDPEPKKKPSPQIVKQFHKWLEKLPYSGQKGFTNKDIKKAHGEGWYKNFKKWLKRGWIEITEDEQTWQISPAGRASLAGGAA